MGFVDEEVDRCRAHAPPAGIWLQLSDYEASYSLTRHVTQISEIEYDQWLVLDQFLQIDAAWADLKSRYWVAVEDTLQASADR